MTFELAERVWGVMASDEGVKFKLTLLGRYDAPLRGNEPQVTVNMAAGHGDRPVYCGNLTMSEIEWNVLSDALRRGLGDALDIDEQRGR
jgi:hypothetical protein